jgi:hypothetical protein
MMKKLIKNVLNDVSKTQVNLESKAAQDMIVNLIVGAIEAKGGRIFYGEPTTADEHNKESCSHGNALSSNCLECDEEEMEFVEMDTAGHEIKKINDYLVRDIKSVKTIDPEEKLYTVVANLGWDAKDKKQMIIGKISESEYEWLIGEK